MSVKDGESDGGGEVKVVGVCSRSRSFGQVPSYVHSPHSTNERCGWVSFAVIFTSQVSRCSFVPNVEKLISRCSWAWFRLVSEEHCRKRGRAGVGTMGMGSGVKTLPRSRQVGPRRCLGTDWDPQDQPGLSPRLQGKKQVQRFQRYTVGHR
jgi:hypothetical protein